MFPPHHLSIFPILDSWRLTTLLLAALLPPTLQLHFDSLLNAPRCSSTQTHTPPSRARARAAPQHPPSRVPLTPHTLPHNTPSCSSTQTHPPQLHALHTLPRPHRPSLPSTLSSTATLRSKGCVFPQPHSSTASLNVHAHPKPHSLHAPLLTHNQHQPPAPHNL